MSSRNNQNRDQRLDIYSFQREFTKIYKTTISKRILPDILKNNLLEKSASGARDWRNVGKTESSMWES